MLAKAGYFGGDASKVFGAPADIVQATLEYEAFEAEKELAFRALNEVKNESS